LICGTLNLVFFKRLFFIGRGWEYGEIVILHFIIRRNGFAFLVKEVPNVWINGERFGLLGKTLSLLSGRIS
jgi:hypothetical protein